MVLFTITCSVSSTVLHKKVPPKMVVESFQNETHYIRIELKIFFSWLHFLNLSYKCNDSRIGTTSAKNTDN